MRPMPRLFTAALILATVVIATSAAAAPVKQCQFKALSLTPAEGTQFRTYRATDGDWTLELTNYNAPKPTTVFSDPPLIVANKTTHSRCSFDGGVWSSDLISLDQTRGRLLAVEASGNVVNLIVYDVTACTTLRSIKVPDGVVDFTATGATFGTSCKGPDIASCAGKRPVAQAKICD